ncbi:MAG: VWA domain-containing protein [Planctomycetota bacterium]|nr:VWA domain-containing protein [Planctomycetota bacterium]
MNFLSNSFGARTLLALFSCSILLSADDKTEQGTDYKLYLQRELTRLEKMAAMEGLKPDALKYIDVRIADIKNRMKKASDAVPGQTVEFMNARAFGSRFVYVIDKSGSMSGKRLEYAKNALLSSLSQYSGNTAFFIIFYDTEVHEMPANELLPATAENLDDCTKWIRGIKAGGKTNPSRAIIRALDLAPDAVFLLSDGLFHDSFPAMIQALNDTDHPVVINTIAFMSDEGAEVLTKIAEQSGGQYVFVKRPEKKKKSFWPFGRKQDEAPQD